MSYPCECTSLPRGLRCGYCFDAILEAKNELVRELADKQKQIHDLRDELTKRETIVAFAISGS